MEYYLDEDDRHEHHCIVHTVEIKVQYADFVGTVLTEIRGNVTGWNVLDGITD